MSLTGPSAGAPTKAGYPVTDVTAGMYGAFGVACALNARARTGLGTVVRTSLLASAACAGLPVAGLLARLDRLGIPAGRVRGLDEVYQWDQAGGGSSASSAGT